MLDIDFVILNYNVYHETIECATSIGENIDTDKYHIVIVDNASPNGVGEKIKAYFADDRRISCVDSGGNLGFARGNNIGIDFCRTKYPSKFICCLNNDTLLEQKNFFCTLEDVYNRYQAAVIGPKIFLRDGFVQPLMPKLCSIEEYQTQLKMYESRKTSISLKDKIKSVLFRWNLLRKLNHFRQQMLHKDLYEINIETYDRVLHGCCLIFTPIFFNNMNGFNPRTFMFREEELLFFMIRKCNLHTLYSPELQILHLEDISTDAVFKKSEEKERFLNENQIKSLKVLIDEMKKIENNKTTE